MRRGYSYGVCEVEVSARGTKKVFLFLQASNDGDLEDDYLLQNRGTSSWKYYGFAKENHL